MMLDDASRSPSPSSPGGVYRSNSPPRLFTLYEHSPTPKPPAYTAKHHGRALELFRAQSTQWGVPPASSANMRPLPYRFDVVNRRRPWSQGSLQPIDSFSLHAPHFLETTTLSGSRMLPGPGGSMASSSRTWLSASSRSSKGTPDSMESMDGRPPALQRALQTERLALVRKQALLKGRLEAVRRRNVASLHVGPPPMNGRLGNSAAAGSVRNIPFEERVLSVVPTMLLHDEEY